MEDSAIKTIQLLFYTISTKTKSIWFLCSGLVSTLDSQDLSSMISFYIYVLILSFRAYQLACMLF